jgi:putative MATE family efflux protein
VSKRKPKFLEGDPMRHIVVMALSASAGLVSVFTVDFLDLYFISLLGRAELAAAVGFAGTLLFFNLSITIGLMIAMSALAAQRIGRGEEEEARRIATSVAVFGLAVGVIVGGGVWLAAPQLLDLIGAVGETKAMAVRYLRIILPTMPVIVMSMICSGLLRAHGDARRAMIATLASGAVNAVLDPLFIFGLGLGLDGAAFASVAARFTMLATAIYPVIRHYGGFAPFNAVQFRRDVAPILAIAGPAILTNIATPVGNIIVTRAIAPFGDAAVAGYAVIGRVTPLAFCVIFALSGAVGPIIGQNFGAGDFGRVRDTLKKSLWFTGAYTAAIWLVMLALFRVIADGFGLGPEGGALLFWFALVITPLFFFNGALFIANAAFNNLNRPTWSTWLNWGKNTVGVAPFVWAGAHFAGAPGVLVGQALGGIFFAVLGVWLGFRLIDRYASGRADPGKGSGVALMRPRPTPPFSSPRG